MAFVFTDLFPSFNTLQVLINLEGTLVSAQAAMSYYASTVVSQIRPFVQTCVTLFVLLYGFALMRGVIKDPLNDVSIRVFKIAIVAELAMNFASYNNYIATFFWNLPEDLVEWLTPAPLITAIKQLVPFASTGTTDLSILLITTVMSAVVEIMNSTLMASNVGGQTDPTSFAAGLGIGAAGAGISAVVAGILLVSKVSLSVLLALGPFFIISIFFEKTKHYFEGWLAQVVNYVVVVVLLTLTIYVLFPILIITVSSYYLIAQLAGSLSLRESVELMTLLGIFMAIIRQVPTTAAALVRGYAINAPGERSLISPPPNIGNQGNLKGAVQSQAEVNAQRR